MKEVITTSFLMYTGVHISKNEPYDSVAEFTADMANWPVGCMRMIFHGDTPTEAAKYVNAMQDAGIFVIGCMQPANNNWANTTVSAYSTYITSYLDAGVSPDVWEIGNEPGATGAGAVGGSYWPKLRAASDILRARQPGAPVILAAPFPTSITPFYQHADTEGILPYIDGFAIHLYPTAPSQSLTIAQNNRTAVDAFSPSWSALPMYVTEWGWSVLNNDQATNPYSNLVVPPGTASDTTAGTQAGNLYVALNALVTNRTALKCRAACWYSAHDLTFIAGQYGFCGVRKHKNAESVASPPTNVGALGDRPSYTRLVSFDAVYDAVAATPPVATSNAATSITQTTAGITGTVDPNGKPTTRYIVWDQDGAPYANTSTGVAVGSGTTPVNVGGILTGLQPNTTYHFAVRAVSVDGVSVSADRTFTTLAPPLAPTVSTGNATGVSGSGATLNGIVDPNGADTTTYAEYGLTSSLGSRVPTADIAVIGDAPVSVSANLTGLTEGTTVYYRWRAINAQGTTLGTTASFVTTAPAPPSTVARPVLPSLDLSVEMMTADGRTYRFDPDDADPRNRPYELSFSTAAGDGFAEGSFVVYRPIDLDYADLKLLVRARFIGSDAQIHYEGRVVAIPRSVDDSGERIQVSLSSLMSSATDRPFMEVFCDRSGDRWQESSLALRLAYANDQKPLDVDFVPQVDAGSLSFKGASRKEIEVDSQGNLEWQAPSGVKAAAFQYKADDKGPLIASKCEDPMLFADDSDAATMGSWDSYSMTNDNTLRSITLTTPRTFLGLRLRCDVLHTAAVNETSHRIIHKMSVYGDHGISLRDNGTEPDGVSASDVIRNVVDRFCPLLDATEISETDTVIDHLVFDTPTMPFDAFTLVNGFHLYLLGAYENGKVMFQPADLNKVDWQVRSDQLGVTLELQGDVVDEFANGIVVSYTDVQERATVLWPTDYAELRDDDPDNPANKEGIERWTTLELSNPATTNGALALGRVALAEFNRPKSPGSVTVAGGYMTDGQENFQPASKVRYGQTLAITDLPNDSPRLITATSWSEDGSLQITLEQPPTRLDAVLARLDLRFRG